MRHSPSRQWFRGRFSWVGGCFLAISTHAASIHWHSFGNPIADSDISLNGVGFRALKLGGVDTTVNGVTFIGVPNGGSFGGFVAVDTMDTTTSVAAWDALSPSYQQLLETGGRFTIPTTLVLDLLTVGIQYEIQLWSHNSGLQGGNWGFQLFDGVQSEDNPNRVFVPSLALNGVGSFVVGSFTATSTEQALLVYPVLFPTPPTGGYDQAVINAIQLREIGGTTDIPETGTLAATMAMLGALGGILFRRYSTRK